jgi:O-antigen ligase
MNLLFSNYYKIFNTTWPNNINFVLISILLSIPALLLGEWSIYFLPLIFLITLCYIFSERFIIALILITLFTLVGELNQSLRAVVHLIDFTLLGILFLKRFGLNFKEYRLIPKSMVYFLLLYFSVMIMSSAMSSYPFAGIGIISEQIAFFIIVYVFYSIINDERDINNYLIAIMVVSFVLVTVSLIQLFSTNFNLLDIIAKDRIRISVLITNAEASSNFYLISFPFLIVLFLAKKQSFNRNLIVAFAIYLSFGLSLAMSRSAILGITLSTAIIFFILRRRRFYQFVCTLIAISILFVFIKPLNETLSLFLRIDSGLSERERVWDMSLNIIRDHPLFGLGPGAYKYEFYNYFPYMLNDWWGKLLIYYHELSNEENFSHNYFLVLFTEMGILGLITAIILPIIYFRIGIKTLIKYRNGLTENYYLIVALFAIGTSIIARNFFNSIGLLYLGGLTGDLPFWLIFSSLIYFYKLPMTKSSGS